MPTPNTGMPQISFQTAAGPVRVFVIDVQQIPAIAFSVDILEQVNGTWQILAPIYNPSIRSDLSQLKADMTTHGGFDGFMAWMLAQINAAFAKALGGSATVSQNPGDLDIAIGNQITAYFQNHVALAVTATGVTASTK